MDEEEKWLPINGFVGLYEVSNLGRVRSLDRMVNGGYSGTVIKRGRILKQYKIKGYLRAVLAYQGRHIPRAVHRLVGEHFLPQRRADQIMINHIDLNKENNAVFNLEWCTALENMRHAASNGIHNATTNPRKAQKLTFEIVSEIRNAHASGLGFAVLGRKFGVCRQTIFKIVHDKIWRVKP